MVKTKSPRIFMSIVIIIIFTSACGLVEDPRISLAKKYIQAIHEKNISEAVNYLAGNDPYEEAEWDARSMPTCDLDSYIYEISTDMFGDEFVKVYYGKTQIRYVSFEEIGGQLYIKNVGGGAGKSNICD